MNISTFIKTAPAAALALSLTALAVWAGDRRTPEITSPAQSIPIAAPVHRIDHDLASDLRCMALNIYFEARSEPIEGQIAVAAVTMNRARDDRFPDGVCDVVRQGGEVRRYRCQFTWWCDGKRDEPRDAEAWHQAQTLARLVYAGVVDDPTEGAMWYHADYVKPYWRKAKQKTVKIGRHIFYRLPRTEAAASPAGKITPANG